MQLLPSTVGGDERGIALIVVLVMLLLLSILGATVLSSTTADLRMTGYSRNSTASFYAADAALEYAETNPDIYTSILPTAPTWPKAADSSKKYPGYAEVKVGKNNAYVKVDYLSTGPVPVEMGTEADSGLGTGTGFLANYYVVSVIGEGAAPTDNSRTEIESQVVKVVPK